jgi:hypothetical protein
VSQTSCGGEDYLVFAKLHFRSFVVLLR